MWESIYPKLESDLLVFWQERLQDYQYIDLVKDKDSSPTIIAGGKEKLIIPEQLLMELMDIAKKVGVTLNSILLAALHRTIADFTETSDSAVVVMFSGRENNRFSE